MSWAEMLRLAVERFGVTPDGFWRLSLREWRMLTETPEQAAMSRDELERWRSGGRMTAPVSQGPGSLRVRGDGEG